MPPPRHAGSSLGTGTGLVDPKKVTAEHLPRRLSQRPPSLGDTGESHSFSACLRRIAEASNALSDVHITLSEIFEGSPVRMNHRAEEQFFNGQSPMSFSSSDQLKPYMTPDCAAKLLGKDTPTDGLDFTAGLLSVPACVEAKKGLEGSTAPEGMLSKSKYTSSWSRIDLHDQSTSSPIVDSVVMEYEEADNEAHAGSAVKSKGIPTTPCVRKRSSTFGKTWSLSRNRRSKGKSFLTTDDRVDFVYHDITLMQFYGIYIPVIHPEAKLRLAWMLIGFLFIVYEAYAIPVYLAFSVDASRDSALFSFISVVNSYFLSDILMSFCTGFTDPKGVHVLEPTAIGARYMRTWLVWDLVAGIPWEWIPTGNSSARLTRSLRFVRAFRLLRLTRLLRLIKLKGVVDKVETFIEASQIFTFVVGIIRILLLLFAVTHWVACIWYVIGMSKGYELTWVKAAGLEFGTGWECYVHSLYFSLTTMTTVGYGDIHPQNTYEVEFALLILLVSSIAFAGLMGTLMDLISELNRQKHILSEKKMQLSRYMHWRIVPRKLMMAIRTHLLFLWDTNEGYDAYEVDLKDLLPPVLKMELCFHIYGRVLSAAPFLTWLKDYACCVKHISNSVKCVFVERGDHLFRLGEANTNIYMLVSGVVWLSRNQTLWEDSLGPLKEDKDKDNNELHADCIFAIPRHKETTLFQFATSVLGQDKRNPKRKTSVSTKAQQAMIIAHLTPKIEEEPQEPIHAKGLYVSHVIQEAERKMAKQDEALKAAATMVQRHFRAKLKARRARRAAQESPTKGSTGLGRSVTTMLSKTVQAPAYFGESCLWIPFDDWDLVPPPMYMYSARCETRGELILISREDIQDLIWKFSPWLVERFEFFREAVVEGYAASDPKNSGEGDQPQRPSSGYRIPVDWAAADLDLPEQETIPMQDACSGHHGNPRLSGRGGSKDRAAYLRDPKDLILPRASMTGAPSMGRAAPGCPGATPLSPYKSPVAGTRCFAREQ